MLTLENITELRRLKKKATPTPWYIHLFCSGDDWSKGDPEFIVALANAALDLLRLAEESINLKFTSEILGETWENASKLKRAAEAGMGLRKAVGEMDVGYWSGEVLSIGQHQQNVASNDWRKLRDAALAEYDKSLL